jgi:hypothetical protein
MSQTEVKIRIVTCGVSLADARDLGEWIGASSHSIFNFPPRSVVLLAIFKFLTDLNIALDSGHGYSYTELHHSSLPFTHDCHVETGLSRH